MHIAYVDVGVLTTIPFGDISILYERSAAHCFYHRYVKKDITARLWMTHDS